MLPSCATLFGGQIADCQKHKPAEGEPKRKMRPAAMVFDILLGYGTGLIVDFADGAIYKPCAENKVISNTFDWSETIEVPNASKSVLYQRGVEWFNATFNDMRAVMQSQDKEAGTFYAKGVILSRDFKDQINNQYFGSSDVISFSINVAVKDGKYKYTISNFIHSGTKTTYSKTSNVDGGDLRYVTATGINKKQWRRIKELVTQRVENSLIPSLKQKMKTASLPETF